MKIKIDENLPAGLVEVLECLGHDVDTVPREGLGGVADDVVLDAVSKAGRFLITQDIDFASASSSDFRHGVLLLRLHNPGRAAILSRIEQVFHSEDVSQWPGAIVVLTETKLRIRRA